MRPIPDGYETRHEIVVTDAMTVDFEDREDPRLGKLHPVYATYWLAKHMELVSRKIILPFLEEGEAGIGFEVAVKHVASALPGMRVTLTARFERMERNRVFATCQAVSELDDVLATGSTVQVILSEERLEGAFDDLRQRFEQHRRTNE
ncbi:MAG: thioesterase family protein [Trueperaceae bacterium]|jgi:predicted thioesterase